MVVKYVTTDAGRWGTGVGRPLTAAEFDENIYTVKGIAETAAAQTPVSIDDFAVDGTNFWVNLTDGSTAGPYALPVNALNARGEWLADTAYAVNDTIYISGTASAYVVKYAHTSAAVFNENATNGDGQYLYGKIVVAPNSALPSGGATGMILAKSSSNDYEMVWTYPTVLLPTGGATGQTLIKYGAGRNDAAWASIPNNLPSGGATGYLLSKTSSSDYATAWIAPPSTLPTGGATGYVLSKISGTDYDVAWISAALSTGPTGAAGVSYTGPTGAAGVGYTGPTGPAGGPTGPTGPGGTATSGKVLIGTFTGAASSSIDLTGWYSSTYDEYEIEILDITTSSNADSLNIYVSTDGGSTYDTGSNYNFAYNNAGAGGSSGTGSTTGGFGVGGVSSSANYSLFGNIKLADPASSIYKSFLAWFNYRHTTANSAFLSSIACIWLNTSAYNAIRIKFATGNISGKVRIYGISK
jgi:hypothetical protein